jgi:hypothetical protein
MLSTGSRDKADENILRNHLNMRRLALSSYGKGNNHKKLL